MRFVLSLSGDDARRLGFTDRTAWEKALRAAVPEAARAMGLAESDLRWCAAFHAEPGHPHAHLMVWEASARRTRGLVSQGERKDLRRVFVRKV